MTSFSFKTLLKVISVEDLQALALNSASLEEICNKLNLNHMQVRYLYRKVGIELSFIKSKKLIPNPEDVFTKEDLLKHVDKCLQIVCRELNLKPKKVINLYIKHDLPVPVRSNNFANKCPISKQELEYEYLSLNKSLFVLSEKYQVSKQQIANWLVFHQIPVRSRGTVKEIPRVYRRHVIWSWSNEEFLNKAKSYASAQEFCENEKMSITIYHSFLDKRKIAPPFPRQKFDFSKDYIVDLYLIKNMTIKQIAEQEGCHWQTINRCLKKYGLVGSKPKIWNIGRKKNN